MSSYGRVSLADALDVRAGDRYIDTTRGGSDPLAGHGGAGENLYLGWNAVPDTASAIDVVVHLHGFTANPPTRAMLEQKVTSSGLDLTGRTRPTLAILPRGRKITADEVRRAREARQDVNPNRYTFPALLDQQGAGLETLIQYALAAFTRDVLGGRRVTIARLVLTAHSGGGAPLNGLLANYARRAACNPHEVHIYDALYGPVQGIADWARNRITADAAFATGGAAAEATLARDGGGCRVLFGPGTRAGSVELARVFPATAPLRAAYRAEATGVGHGDIPRVFGRALLTSVRSELVLVPSRGHSARLSATTPPKRWRPMTMPGVPSADDAARTRLAPAFAAGLPRPIDRPSTC